MKALTDTAHASLLAALLIAGGSSLGDHLQLLLAIPLTTLGFLCACKAAARAGSHARHHSYWWIDVGLAMNAGVAIAIGPPAHSALWYQVLYWTYFAAAVVAIGAIASAGADVRRRTIWTIVGFATLLHVVTPLATPRPTIDVWTWTDACVRALLQGVHPYTVRAIDATRGAFDYGYVNTVYPYMPLTLIVNAPATAVLGDYRFGLALCLPATIVLLRSAGHRLAIDERLIDTVTLGFVLHPRSVYMVSLGWTELWLVLALAVFLWCAARRGSGLAQDIAFMILPALKQYVVTPVAIYAAMQRRWRAIAIGAGVIAASVGPFMLRHWQHTLEGVFFPLRDAFREDSISLMAVIARLTPWTPPQWIGPLAQVVVGAVAYVRLRGEHIAGVLLASALALCASFLLGTQAFVNYYYFVMALMLCTALVHGQRESRP